MRRSSSPTLTKTNGASSCPVFDPAKVAGSPFAFLTVAVFAMSSPVHDAILLPQVNWAWLPLKNEYRGDQQAKEDRHQYRWHQPLAKIEIWGRGHRTA
jgi:hypothetical protein